MSKQKPQEDPEFGLGKKFIELYRLWHEEDDDFRRWFDKYDSPATRRDYLYSAAVLFEAAKLRPGEIVSRYAEGGKTRRDMLDDVDLFITKLEREEKVHMARNIWTYVVSLLKARGAIMDAAAFELKKPEVKIRAPQYIPSEEQYQVMLRYALSARNRFLLSFFRSGGPRIGATNDPDPMRLRHLLDLDLKALEVGEIKFKHSSSCAVLIYGVFKGGEIVRYNETYVTFLLPETMTYLSEYLQERIRLGEKLTGDSYLFRASAQDAATHSTQNRSHVSSARSQYVQASQSRTATERSRQSTQLTPCVVFSTIRCKASVMSITSASWVTSKACAHTTTRALTRCRKRSSTCDSNMSTL